MPNIRDFGNGENIVPLHSEIGDVHQLAADVDYFFAKLNKLKQVFRARKSDVDNIGVCGNRTLHSEYSPKTI